MVLYNFKKIETVPTAKDFIDVILSKTQRKTPTVVHKGYAINRIRQFYMRKVKYTQQNYNEKLQKILTDFPRVDDIHPFYADLLNVLYDKDHYKLALGQINTARSLIDTLGKDYIRLLKYGDSLYRCKSLKKACLGRMCTLTRKLNASLVYLEQVRQHLGRLPSIDPSTRTLILCGYPNVGKSSFMNKVTRANVDVQHYAFTTKSLFVGHMDYKYLRWQVIDTPGILDHPLEERNVIEMQSVTALAHLRAAVLFILDVSESCGFTIKEQVSLFHSIKPLFTGKPLLVIVNKTDLRKLEDLNGEDAALVRSVEGEGVTVMQMSTMSEDGVSAVKNQACELLLEFRVAAKIKQGGNAENGDIHLAAPVPRDAYERLPVIPESQFDLSMHKTQKEKMLEGGGAGVYSMDFREQYLLSQDEYKFDTIPEIMDGKNIADFVDPDILAKLEQLEREEEELLQAEEAAAQEDDDDVEGLDGAQSATLMKIRKKKALMVKAHRDAKNANHPKLTRSQKAGTAAELDKQLEDMGMDEETRGRVRARSKSRPGRSKSRGEEEEEGEEGRGRKRARSASRSQSRVPTPSADGFRSPKALKKAVDIGRKAQFQMNKYGKQGESDRFIGTAKPKHLFTQKKGFKNTRR